MSLTDMDLAKWKLDAWRSETTPKRMLELIAEVERLRVEPRRGHLPRVLGGAGAMSDTNRKCTTCRHVDKFTPRKDELERGLTLGCRYPNYEGYTSDAEPACGGDWWQPAERKAAKEALGR